MASKKNADTDRYVLAAHKTKTSVDLFALHNPVLLSSILKKGACSTPNRQNVRLWVVNEPPVARKKRSGIIAMANFGYLQRGQDQIHAES